MADTRSDAPKSDALKSDALRLGLFIPTLNAGPFLARLVDAIRRQDRRPDTFVVINSMSDDETRKVFAAHGAQTYVIDRSAFNHGGTRQLAVGLMHDCDILMFLTQDAIPTDPSAFGRLLAAFEDETVGAAYGRQAPRPNAGPLEAYSRQRNYGSRGHRRTARDISRLGIRAAFMSNAFAAYRRSALLSIGGFPKNVIFGEDMHAAAALLKAGWATEYRADAVVEHSHNHTIVQDFKRYFDVGVMMARSPLLSGEFGGPAGEGAAHVRQQIGYLWRTAPSLIPVAACRASASWAAYMLGRNEASLPLSLKRRISSNRSFWAKSHPRNDAGPGDQATPRPTGT